jgi:endoglucanase
MKKHRVNLASKALLIAMVAVLSPPALGAPDPNGWMYTQGNHIYTDTGTIWAGRGANIHDTRSCNACTYNAPNVNEVLRRIDELVDNWHANFLRLDLESYASSGGRVNWASVLNDPNYLQDIVTIVDHIKTKPGVKVLMSLWEDPSFTSQGWPTADTANTWRKLAETFRDDSHVMFGVCNEPQQNYDGSQDAQVWQAMNNVVAAIRAVEDQYGTPHHIVTVQGTGGWARRLDYYVTHPITAGGGVNVAYETHVYDPTSDFQSLFVTPGTTLPVVIGEFGPFSGSMSESDGAALMTKAESLKIPYTAWTFHQRCPPNLLVENSGGGCGVGMALQPTSWGNVVKTQLSKGAVTPPPDESGPDASVPDQSGPDASTPDESGPDASVPDDSGPDASTPDESGPDASVPPVTYDPSFRVGPNCNNWWVEVYAKAASVEVETATGSRVALPKTSWGSFAKSFYVATGAKLRLRAVSSTGQTAQSNFFAFMREQPVLATGGGSTQPPPATWSPTFRLGQINEWWVEVYVDQAVSVRVSVAGGAYQDLPKKSWGPFAKSIYVRRGTSVTFQATRADGAVATKTVTWLQ